MVSGLCRLWLLSVLLPLVLVAPPLGGSLSARPAAPAASSQPSGRPDNLTGVACLSPSTCFAVRGSMILRSTDTYKGTILRSTDGGRTWRRQPSGTTSYLNGVACLSPGTCVTVGDNSTILRSTDGGRTWRRQPSGIGMPNHLAGVACLSPSTCVAVGLGRTIVRSTDGGRTWRRQPSGTRENLAGVACSRPSTCVAVGIDFQRTPARGMILRSTDGGRTWRSQPSGTTHELNGVACPSPSTCVVVGASISPPKGAILWSTDGGSSWRSI
jgi:photosystem II stability/assembly factor-like uncharacterized protein